MVNLMLSYEADSMKFVESKFKITQTVMKIIAKFFSFSLDRIYIYFDKFLLRRTRNLRLIPSIYRRKGGKKSYAEWAHVIGIFQTIFCQNLKSENNVVFDIGCGTGLLGIAAEPHVNEGGKYIGIDVSVRDIGFVNVISNRRILSLFTLIYTTPPMRADRMVKVFPGQWMTIQWIWQLPYLFGPISMKMTLVIILRKFTGS